MGFILIYNSHNFAYLFLVMKKITLTLSFCFATLISFAQVELTLYTGPAFMYANLKKEFSLTGYNIASRNEHLRFGAGFRASIPINEKIKLESGLRHIRKDYWVWLVKEYIYEFHYRSQWYFRVNSWEIPVTIAYQPDVSLLGSNLTFRAGLALTYNESKLLSNTQYTRMFNPPSTVSHITNYDFDGYRKITGGAEVGISFYPMLIKGFEFGAVYHLDFAPTFKEIRYDNEIRYASRGIFYEEKMSGSFSPRLTSYIMLQLGYTFGKKKKETDF